MVTTLKKIGRQLYKSTGYKNPMKKGKLSTTRIQKQIPKLMKDINILKGIINSEKFRVESQPFDQIGLGQITGNLSGHRIYDFTPLPSQGDGFNNRQGNSIRWKSSHYSFFFQRQQNSVGPCTIKLQLIKIIGEPYTTPANAIEGKFIEANRWIGGATIYDTASDRKPEYFKQFRVLRTVNVKFPALDVSGTGASTQKIVNFGLKLKSHHVKWNNNSNTLSDGQVLLLMTMDTGNYGSLSTLDSVANTAASTGVLVSCNKIDYYYDN